LQLFISHYLSGTQGSGSTNWFNEQEEGAGWLF
jgi:hypothetical protein